MQFGASESRRDRLFHGRRTTVGPSHFTFDVDIEMLIERCSMEAPTTASNPAPLALETITDPRWLAGALTDRHSSEHIVEVHQVGASATLASKVRFSVLLDGPQGQRTRHYCLKAHFNVGGVETLVTEANFYRHLRPQLDIRAPVAHYVGINEPSGRAVVIMDDIDSLGGQFLSADTAYTAEQSCDALSQLARFHASTWGALAPAADWLQPRIETMGSLFPSEHIQTLLDDGRGSEVHADLLDAPRLRRAMLATAQLPSTCVIHGDTHSGNAYLDAEGRVCWLDWQITQRGHWAVDVSYHLASTLGIEDRRANEADRLRFYLDELARFGVLAPSWGEAWDLYTLGFTWGYYLWVITTISSRSVVMIHTPRLGAALADHDTFRRLGVR